MQMGIRQVMALGRYQAKIQRLASDTVVGLDFLPP
jgi:hypothetical protein